MIAMSTGAALFIIIGLVVSAVLWHQLIKWFYKR